MVPSVGAGSPLPLSSADLAASCDCRVVTCVFSVVTCFCRAATVLARLFRVSVEAEAAAGTSSSPLRAMRTRTTSLRMDPP